MCLVVFAWNTHRDYRLIVAANRDELHRRPTEDAGWWPDQPDTLAGRDLQAGGTWLAVSRTGRFATVTNYREQSLTAEDCRSRGELVTQFVNGKQDPLRYCRDLDGTKYAGFSLLAANENSLAYVSNRGDPPVELEAGIYALSNASLDAPWSKTTRSRKKMQALIQADSVSESTMMDILMDRETADEDANTEHLSADVARALTAPFIINEDFGTRSSTLLFWHISGEIEFIEQRFDSGGRHIGQSRFSF